MKPATILYGTVTGNAAECAKKLGKTLQASGVPNRVLSMSELPTEDLPESDLVLVVTSTTGNGDPPYSAQVLHRHLHHDRPELAELRFGVLAMGNRLFAYFAQCGKDFDAILGELGAERVVERVDCDGHYEDPLDDFQNRLFDYFSENPDRYPDFKRPEPPPPPPPPPPEPVPRSQSSTTRAESPPKPRSVLRRLKDRIKRNLRRGQ